MNALARLLTWFLGLFGAHWPRLPALTDPPLTHMQYGGPSTLPDKMWEDNSPSPESVAHIAQQTDEAIYREACGEAPTHQDPRALQGMHREAFSDLDAGWSPVKKRGNVTAASTTKKRAKSKAARKARKKNR